MTASFRTILGVQFVTFFVWTGCFYSIEITTKLGPIQDGEIRLQTQGRDATPWETRDLSITDGLINEK